MLFLVALLFLKTTSEFKNTANQEQNANGLAYGNAVIEDLVNRDSDLDGILDWEEGLWGTDPAQAETTPGIPDSVAVNKLKGELGENTGTASQGGQTAEAEENLTETDKFSDEPLSSSSITIFIRNINLLAAIAHHNDLLTKPVRFEHKGKL